MTYAAITGWGKCMPPAVLDNAGLASFMDTTDEWITTRTGIKERRVSHVPMTTLSHVASMRALACAGMDPKDIDLVVLGTCSADEQVPNTASAIQLLIGATKAAAMDINTACTSFLYGLSTATAMIRTGVVRNALVIGVEGITPYMDWSNRNVAVLFGDGAAAVVVQASDKPEGVIAEKLGCYADARAILRVRGMGTIYGNAGVQLGDTTWDFDGQEIFKRAVHGMSRASQAALERAGISADQIDLVVPHQANLRIIESVAKHSGISMERVFVTVQQVRQHVVGDCAGGARRGARRRSREARIAAADARVRRRIDVVLARDPLGRSRHAARHDGHRSAAVHADGGRDRSGHHHEEEQQRRGAAEDKLACG